MRLHVALVAVVAALALAGCTREPTAAPPVSPGPLESLLPASLEGQRGIALEDRTGIIETYTTSFYFTWKASDATPVIKVSILTPPQNDRDLGITPGWYRIKSDDSFDITEHDYKGHKAQLVEHRYGCAPHALGLEVDRATCASSMELAIRLSHDRVLVVDRDPAKTESVVLVLADQLDLAAIEAAAQHTIVGSAP
jgi:hypothetical protein